MPLFAVFFGEIVDSFIAIVQDPTDPTARALLQEEVNQICVKFLYLAAVASVSAFVQLACFSWVGKRQAHRVREEYYRCVSFLFFSFLFFFPSLSSPLLFFLFFFFLSCFCSYWLVFVTLYPLFCFVCFI